jgi:MraZ protein
MFRGQFVHTIDQKGRISLPARFREALEAAGDMRLILTRAPFEPCLHLYPLSVWQAYEEKISDLPSLDPDIVRFRRLYISPAVDLEIDAGGRVLVTPDFRRAAQLEKEALWAGMGRTAELWSKPRFEEAMEMTPAELADFRKKVQELIRI